MLLRYYCLIFSLLPLFSFAQSVDPASITIARDSWGVPHIKAPTHAATAYGLAWATCEDDFKTIQHQLLAVRSRLAEVTGPDGAALDIVVQYLMLDSLIEREYPQALSPEFNRVLLAYCRGVNAYARDFPKEVLRPRLFPVGPRDLLKGYAMGQALLTGAAGALGQIMNDHLPEQTPRGSNAIAVNKARSGEETTHLIVNSHQPLEGLFSWYEAHLVNDEGVNILGATFPGGLSIFHGANAHLGWAHTVNKPDFADIYRLEMNPSGALEYRFDGKWLPLRPFKARAKVKVGPLRLPVSRKFYRSKHGLVLKNESGYYALRIVANHDIRGAEQWWRMNQAHNLEEFKEALSMQGIAGTNIVYADAEDHIYYVSNGRLPKRNASYDWSGILPGDTSATLWSPDPIPFQDLLQQQDPASGFLYNTNHSPFRASGLEDNLDPTAFPAHMGYELYENNRSRRFRSLAESAPALDMKTLERIKYDESYADSLKDPAAENLELLLSLSPEKAPELNPILDILANWDRRMDTLSTGASAFVVSQMYLYKALNEAGEAVPGNKITEAQVIAALSKAQKHLLKHYGEVSVPLREVQRHVRGSRSLAVAGGPETLRAMYCQFQKDGSLKSYAGESYILWARWDSEGIHLESVNAFGASANPESLHYTDQMPLFVQKKRKPMTLDWEQVVKDAVRVYSPK